VRRRLEKRLGGQEKGVKRRSYLLGRGEGIRTMCMWFLGIVKLFRFLILDIFMKCLYYEVLH
jgi:hypothetical protein